MQKNSKQLPKGKFWLNYFPISVLSVESCKCVKQWLLDRLNASLSSYLALSIRFSLPLGLLTINHVWFKESTITQYKILHNLCCFPTSCPYHLNHPYIKLLQTILSVPSLFCWTLLQLVLTYDLRKISLINQVYI